MDLDKLIKENNIKALSYMTLKNYEVNKTFLSEGLSSKTLFSSCSISKLITVVAVLIAADEGKIDIKSDINTYLKDWQLKGGSVSPADLMTNQSGLADSDGAYETFTVEDGKPSLLDLIKGNTNYIKEEIILKSEPRKEFIYSDNNILLLEKLLEDTYDMNFRDIVLEKVLKPLGMNNSRYINYEDLDSSEVALGTDKNGNYIEKEQNIYPYDSVAGLWTTCSDLCKLLTELLRSYAGKSEKLLQTSTAKEMLTAQGVVDFTGYGVFVYNLRGKDVFYTQGWGTGFQSYMMGSLEEGDGIVVMMNQNPWVEQMEGPIGEIVRQWIEEKFAD